jgi:hypothetical protein
MKFYLKIWLCKKNLNKEKKNNFNKEKYQKILT